MQDSAAALSEGVARDASRAAGELEQFRESLARLEVACEQRNKRVQAMEQRLDDLQIYYADGDARHEALRVRMNDVEEEHRKLDGAIADVAKMGLLAVQVARHARADPPASAWTLQDPTGKGVTSCTAESLSPGNKSPASTKQVPPSVGAVPGSSARKSAPAAIALGTRPSTPHNTGARLQRGNVPSLQIPRDMSPPLVQQPREFGTLCSSSSWSNLGSPQNPPQQMQPPGWHRLQWPMVSGLTTPSTVATASAPTIGTAVSAVPSGSPPLRARRLPGEETSSGATESKSIDGSRSLQGSLSARSEVRPHTGQSNSGNGDLSARRQPAGTRTVGYHC